MEGVQSGAQPINVGGSWLISDIWFKIWRVLAALVLVVMLIVSVIMHDFPFLYYTTLNYALISMSMSALALCTLTQLQLPPKLQTFIGVCAQLSLQDAIFLDLVYWTLLASGSRLAKRSVIRKLDNYARHLVNAVVAIIDFTLNGLGMHWQTLGVGVLLLVLYLFGFVYLNFALTGRWLYPFLDYTASPPLVVATLYIGLFFAYVLLFVVLRTMCQLKPTGTVHQAGYELALAEEEISS